MADAESSEDEGFYTSIVKHIQRTEVSKEEKVEAVSNEETREEEKEGDGNINAAESGASNLPGLEEALEKVECQFEKDHAAMERERKERKRQEREARERMEAEKAKGAAAGAKSFQLPEITWHVPMTSFEFVKEEEEKAKLAEKRKGDIKSNEKAKRMKGQSSHASWKSEGEMKLRQQFD